MKRRRLLDTNLIVRHLVQDQPKLAKVADLLFAACDRGELVLVILSGVLAECVFVLESFYKHRRGDVADALGKLIESPGIEISDTPIHLDALKRYGKSSLHFIDCLIAAYGAGTNTPVATFDDGFKKFTDVRVIVDVDDRG